MAAVVLRVMHRCLVGMIQSMFAVFQGLAGRMVGSDVVLGVAVLPCLLVMLVGRFVMAGGNFVAFRYGQVNRRCDRR